MTIRELIERLEKATGPDRALDAEIAVALRIAPDAASSWFEAGFPSWRAGENGQVYVVHDTGETGAWGYARLFTASIDAALTLVPEGLSYEFRCSSFGECSQAIVWDGRKSPQVSERARVSINGVRPAIALCIAALKAREARG